ncbi:MAG: hypothetical protein WC634_02845 [archaeon]
MKRKRAQKKLTNWDVEKLDKERNFTYLLLSLALIITAGLSSFYFSQIFQLSDKVSDFDLERRVFYIENEVKTDDNFLVIDQNSYPVAVQERINLYHRFIEPLNQQFTFFIGLFIFSLLPLFFVVCGLLSLLDTTLGDWKWTIARIKHSRNMVRNSIYFTFTGFIVAIELFSSRNQEPTLWTAAFFGGIMFLTVMFIFFFSHPDLLESAIKNKWIASKKTRETVRGKITSKFNEIKSWWKKK